MADRIRAVLCGCGGISNAWLNPAKARDDLAIVGLVDVNEENARKRAAEHGLQAATGTDLVEVIRRTKADVVFDCTPPEIHARVVVAALEAGCHVLGEKPMADTMENARWMAETAERADRLYAVIQNRRYMAGIRAVREFIRSGALGTITTIQSDFFIGAHFGGFRDVMQHVLLLDMAIHTFDQMRCLTGLDAASVYAEDWNPAGSWYRHGASALASFDLDNGGKYIYHGSWCSEGCNTSWECDWRIIGTEGSLRWDGGDGIRAEVLDPSATTGFMREKQTVEVPVTPLPEARQGHAGLLDDFLAAVRGGPTPDTICTDNIKSLAMVHAAIRSAETGRREAVQALTAVGAS